MDWIKAVGIVALSIVGVSVLLWIAYVGTIAANLGP